jgi:hypothetical protein
MTSCSSGSGLELTDLGFRPLGPALGTGQILTGLGALLADAVTVGLGPGSIVDVKAVAAHGS